MPMTSPSMVICIGTPLTPSPMTSKTFRRGAGLVVLLGSGFRLALRGLGCRVGNIMSGLKL